MKTTHPLGLHVIYVHRADTTCLGWNLVTLINIFISFPSFYLSGNIKFPRPLYFTSWKLSCVGSCPQSTPSFILFWDRYLFNLLISFSTSLGFNIKISGGIICFILYILCLHLIHLLFFIIDLYKSDY